MADFHTKNLVAIINKLIDLGIYQEHNQWQLKDEFQYIELSKEEEKNIKQEVETLWT
jgi:hypothetical protein